MIGTAIDTLLVIAKRPVAGRVKTRLVPPLTFVQAAELAAAALTDTIAAVDSVPSQHKVLAFDGSAAGWEPRGWMTRAQDDGGLDERLAAAFDSVGGGSALLVGMDTPQLRPDQLAEFDPSSYDACLGPAADGGYWAIGFRDARAARLTIPGVQMSTAHTGVDQLRRLHDLGLRVQILDELVDVDTIVEAQAVAATAPHTAFAKAFVGMCPAPMIAQVG